MHCLSATNMDRYNFNSYILMPCQPQISGCKGSIRRTGRWNNAGSGSATVPATHFGRHTLWGTMRIEFQVRPKTILSEKPICLGFVRSDNHYVYLQPISSSASVASICVQPSATTVTSYMTGKWRTAGVSGSTISNNYAIRTGSESHSAGGANAPPIHQ